MKRIKFLAAVFVLMLALVTFRVFSVSVLQHDELSKAAQRQHTGETPVRTARKILYDRNMIPLTEAASELYAVIICENCTEKEKVSMLLETPLPDKGVEVVQMPSDKAIQKELLSCQGVSSLSLPVRYLENDLFCHLIGYGGSTNGSGLEKALDNSLTTDKSQTVYTVNAANEHPLWTEGYYSPSETDLSGVKLTVDIHIQKICEQVMDELCPKGAVVVTDAVNGDILAMASRPAYSQEDPASYFDGGGSELLNRAICAYDMGSVFKIIVAGAALEEGLVDIGDKFTCTGTYTVGEVDFHCHKRDGHETLTFEQAFANSCNIPFYELGQKLGWDTIREYAQKCGFGKNIIDLALDEAYGVLPQNADSAPALANLSIGQGDMTGTPLQVAQMIQTVANGGLKTPLVIVDGKIKSDGKTFTASGREETNRVFSSRTALILRRLMKATVQQGTGKQANSDTISIAGKTGSAETGWQNGSRTMTHGWFAGFFPAESPKYVCVVLCEDGQSGGSTAGPVFKKIAEQIAALY